MLTRSATSRVRANRFLPEGGNPYAADSTSNPFGQSSNATTERTKQIQNPPHPQQEDSTVSTDSETQPDPSKLGHFHAVLFEPPSDPDDVVYMSGYDSGSIDMARRLASMEPEIAWFPFTSEPHGVRTTTLDGFMAYIVPKDDQYTWWIDSPRSGAVVVAGRESDPDAAMIAVEAHLDARAHLAPLAALVDHVLEHNPGIDPIEAVQVAKTAQRIAWQAVEPE